jgi:aromatic-amino-acid transaminase
MDFLIPSRNNRPADDPIFALNTEANARRAKGESIINATVGALLDDDGKLAVLPTVVEALRAVPAQQAAGYAPLAGPTTFLAAVIA